MNSAVHSAHVRAGGGAGWPMPSARDSGSQNTDEAVGHADAEMDRQRGRRHQPAVEARLGDDFSRDNQLGGAASVATRDAARSICFPHGDLFPPVRKEPLSNKVERSPYPRTRQMEK